MNGSWCVTVYEKYIGLFYASRTRGRTGRPSVLVTFDDSRGWGGWSSS